MASSKLMSRNSDLKRKLSSRASTSSTSDFLRIDSSSAREDFVSDGYFRNSYLEKTASVENQSKAGMLLNAEINVLDSSAPVAEPRRRTVDDVWREIVEGKKKEEQKKQPPKEEIMTLEDFLVQAGAVEEAAVVEVKEEEEFSVGGGNSYENNNHNNNNNNIASSYSGSVIGMGMSGDFGEFGKGRGKRSMSLLEPLDKVAQQRQRRMIKNRESAARSRERKQAYQVELESMAVRLEEENERLMKERDELMRNRLQQLLENVIPVVEKRRPPRVLRRVRSMLW